jgi:hypothetical protein
MARVFSASRYSLLAAAGVWWSGWVAATFLAVRHLADPARDASAVVALLVAGAFTLVGGLLVSFAAVGSRARHAGEDPLPPTPKETWSRRVTGWFAAAVWCGVAVAWNVGIITWLLRDARDGHGWQMLILIPWSVIGGFLLLVLFTSAGMIIDGLLDALRGLGR